MKRIFIDIRLNETRVAVKEEGELVELYFERPLRESLVGNVYIGKVSSVLPGMQAAFIDIGYERNAFLYLSDALSIYQIKELENGEKDVCDNYDIGDILKVGEEIVVQVTKEAIGTKGPRVTRHLTLPGKYFVLTPYNDYIGVSLKIGNEAERDRLKDIADKLLKENIGAIIRTDAKNKRIEELENDIEMLYENWEEIKEKKKKKGKVPRCIFKEQDIVIKSIRDLLSQDVDRLIINDKKTYKEIRKYIKKVTKEYISKVKYEDDIDLFENYNIEPYIKKAISNKVWLKCGGYIVIDKTEALTVIDVNTGKYIGNSSLEETVSRTNLDAAVVIAKQLRLRDISGIIIVDFIDMQNERNREKVIEVLAKELKKDSTKTNIIGMTGLGLIEITRKKIRQGLDKSILVDCKKCQGTGKKLSPIFVLSNLEKRIEKDIKHFGGKQRTYVMNDEIANLITTDYIKDIKYYEEKYNVNIDIKADKDLKREEMIIIE